MVTLLETSRRVKPSPRSAASYALLAGSSNPRLAGAIAAELDVPLGDCHVERFPDGELRVDVREPLRRRAVYIVQSTAPPVAEHLLELLLLADACWRGGAARITAVIPYFGYARQDRRSQAGESLGSALVAEALGASGIDQCMVVDLHSPAIEGSFEVPVVQLSAIPALIERLQPAPRRRRVIVAPDLGAAKLAERYGKVLGLPVALVHKRRLTGSTVAAGGLVGEVRASSPIIVDDMISTGGTIEAAVNAVLEAGASEDIVVVATHALLVGDAVARLSVLPIRRLLITDSVARPGRVVPPRVPFRMEVASLAALLAEEIRRMEHVPARPPAQSRAARTRRAGRRA
jgi:ribose-phosphate pyrophosphokinase